VHLICGVDEAGRGPLAGAVFAACVIFNPAKKIAGLADSKKLSEKRRDYLAQVIKADALAWAVASASVEEIDRINILQASLLAMRRAVESLSVLPSEVLVDGNRCPQWTMPLLFSSRAIVGGDNLVAEISAASILAKTARDAAMYRLHQEYPHYGFDRHKGYGTALHLAALQQHGVSRVHRKSFAPVRNLIVNSE